MSSEIREHPEEANGVNNGTPPAKKLKKDPSAVTDNGSELIEDNGLGADASLGDADYDSEAQKALEEIDTCQNEIDSLNEKASEEILKVEQKYNKLRKPFFEKRNDLIKKIPNFWISAFVNHPQIRSLLNPEEEECLHYLSQLEVEEFEDIKSGYRINFHFEENPYFENKTLVKEYHLASTGDPTCTSSDVLWKETVEANALKDSINGVGKQRKRKALPEGPFTFFMWLVENGDASNDEIAELVKDDLWPNPLQYFLYSDMDHGPVDDDSDDEEDDDHVVVIEEDEDADEEAEDEEAYDEEGDEEGEDGIDEEDADD